MTHQTALSCLTRSLLATAILLAAHSAAADEWGTIKGKFTFGGEAPVAAELKADKDIEVCGKHKLVVEELVVGPDKGVANVVVFVRDKEVKVHPDLTAAAKAEKVVLDNQGCRFEPHVTFVQIGQQFVIKNTDAVGHNSNVSTLKNPPSNSLIPSNGETAMVFASEEVIPAQVTCNIHPWMKSWLVVRGNPYAAISKADGSFEIKNLPAGELELQLWHEKAGYIGEIKVGGKVEKIAKGRKKVKVAGGDNDLGEMVLDANLFKK